MTERWRQPVIPLAIEDDLKMTVRVTDEGHREVRTFKEVQLVLRDEDIERIRTGYVCIWCQEPFERPFPEKCGVCGFACRDEQTQLFERQYQGWEPALVPLADKVAALDEQDARKAHTPGRSIWLPGDDP